MASIEAAEAVTDGSPTAETPGSVAEPPGQLRALDAVRVDDASSLGDEAVFLARLAASAVPIATGWIAPLVGPDTGALLERALSYALDGVHVGAGPRETRGVEVRPWFCSRAVALRCARLWPVVGDLADASRVPDVVAQLLEGLAAPQVRAAMGARADGVHARIVLFDRDAPLGRAASADATGGDPELVAVWTTGGAPWLVDRRTMRVAREGSAPLDAMRAARIADLADRAQLVLGRPVEIEWCMQGGRPVVAAARPITLVPAFTRTFYSRVTLVAADDGTVAPLTVDALARALGRDDDLHRTSRACAASTRARTGAPPTPPAVPRTSATRLRCARAAARAARVAADIAAPVAAGRRFEHHVAERLAPLDAQELGVLGTEALAVAIRERHKLVVEAFTLLDRLRLATLAVLPALEAASGPLPREAFAALAAPRLTKQRRRLQEKLARLAGRIEAEAGDLGLAGRRLARAAKALGGGAAVAARHAAARDRRAASRDRRGRRVVDGGAPDLAVRRQRDRGARAS